MSFFSSGVSSSIVGVENEYCHSSEKKIANVPTSSITPNSGYTAPMILSTGKIVATI